VNIFRRFLNFFRPKMNISISVVNPLGCEDWDKIYEEKIKSAIDRGMERNL